MNITITQRSIDAFLCLYAHACEQGSLASQQQAGEALLSLRSTSGTLWADLSELTKQWKQCQNYPLLQALTYEQEAQQQYHRACQHHRQDLPFQTAYSLEASIKSFILAMQFWVEVGVHAERRIVSSVDVSSLLQAGTQAHRLCLLLSLLQQMLLCYCQAFSLVPRLIEDEEEEEEVSRR